MNDLIDLHTHTIACGHAYNTLYEMAAAAADQRVKLTMDVGAMDNRIRLLTEMEKEYEGFSKAVKLVCQARGSLRGPAEAASLPQSLPSHSGFSFENLP